MYTLQTRVSPDLRCAYCHDRVATAQSACPRCGTGLHPGCWKEAVLCPTLGCGWTANRPRVTVSPKLAANEQGQPRVRAMSVLTGAFGALLWGGSAVVVPAFARIYSEVGVPLSASRELLFGVPAWGWWALAVLSVGLLALKDRWLEPSVSRCVNLVYCPLVVVAGGWILITLFSGLLHTYERF